MFLLRENGTRPNSYSQFLFLKRLATLTVDSLCTLKQTKPGRPRPPETRLDKKYTSASPHRSGGFSVLLSKKTHPFTTSEAGSFAMGAFVDGDHVWLRNVGRDLYLHADADGLGVSVHSRRAVLQAAWSVHLSGDHVLLHSAAYGRYLGVSGQAPRGHLGRAATQLDFVVRGLQSIAWESIAADEGSTDAAVILRNATGGYLRANGRIRRWNTAVSVSDAPAPGDLSNMSFWVAETIPPLPVRMDIPLPVEVSTVRRVPQPFLSGSEH